MQGVIDRQCVQNFLADHPELRGEVTVTSEGIEAMGEDAYSDYLDWVRNVNADERERKSVCLVETGLFDFEEGTFSAG